MNKQELAEQILKSLAKRNGFSNWNEILNDYNKGFTSEETFKALILAAIVEALNTPAKEGMKWVKASERLPEVGKEVFWNRHEKYPVWGRYSKDGGFHDLVTIDDTGEEEAEPLNYDWEWLDESAPAKEVEAISDSEYTPYCPVCSACGEDGCCSPLMCEQSPNGHYCEHYLKTLKVTYATHNSLMIWVDERKEQYGELIDREGWLFSRQYDRFMLNKEQNDERIATNNTKNK